MALPGEEGLETLPYASMATLPLPLASPFLVPTHMAGILRTTCHHDNPEDASEAMVTFSRSSDLLLPSADHVTGIVPTLWHMSFFIPSTHGASWSWHQLKGWLVQCQPGCRPSQLRGTWCWGTGR